MHKFKSLGINNELVLKQICKQFAKILQTLYTFRRKHIGANIKEIGKTLISNNCGLQEKSCITKRNKVTQKAKFTEKKKQF